MASRTPARSRSAAASRARPCAASGEHERRVLFQGLGVRVDDFRCRAHVAGLGAEEPNATHSIVFVRRGLFTRTDRGGTVVADVNQVLFFNRDQPYRYAHPLPGGDDCTILALDDGCAWALVERCGPCAPDGALGPFPVGQAPSTRRAARLHLELLAATRAASSTPELARQEIVAELIEEAAQALRGSRVAREAHETAARRRDVVEGAKLHLNRALEAPPSLDALATALDCSPFHLSRLFRTATGLGLRHYVRRLRARQAAERLGRGACDLTALALALGFCDQSHFTNSFRREWGVPPSRLAHGEDPGERARPSGPRTGTMKP